MSYKAVVYQPHWTQGIWKKGTENTPNQLELSIWMFGWDVAWNDIPEQTMVKDGTENLINASFLCAFVLSKLTKGKQSFERCGPNYSHCLRFSSVSVFGRTLDCSSLTADASHQYSNSNPVFSLGSMLQHEVPLFSLEQTDIKYKQHV